MLKNLTNQDWASYNSIDRLNNRQTTTKRFYYNEIEHSDKHQTENPNTEQTCIKTQLRVNSAF